MLQRTFGVLPSKISNRSSTRMTSTLPKSRSTVEKTLLQPLRSMPWFQHTKFDFERTRIDHCGSGGGRLIRSSHQPILDEAGATDGRHYRIVGNSEKVTPPSSGITVRKSIDLSSIHIEESIAPSHWIWAGSSGEPLCEGGSQASPGRNFV